MNNDLQIVNRKLNQTCSDLLRLLKLIYASNLLEGDRDLRYLAREAIDLTEKTLEEL